MQIPRYWAKATLPCEKDGRTISITCWRGSAHDTADARARAEAAVRKAADAVRTGGRSQAYDYGQRELREEVLEEHHGPEGQPLAILTRNRYGAVILNAADLFFADLDLAPPTLWARCLHLFGRPLPDAVAVATQAVAGFCAANPLWSFRIYRTFNGLRLMATHAPQDPGSAGTRAVQARLGSDPLFIRLCQAQQSFRARLTPKPWRVGLPRPAAYPREGPAAESGFRTWLAGYRRASESHATCHFLQTAGSGAIDPGFAPLVQLHDERTRAFSGLPLA